MKSLLLKVHVSTSTTQDCVVQMCIHNLMIFMSYSAFFFCLLSVNKQVFKLPQVLSVDRFEGIKGDLELTN